MTLFTFCLFLSIACVALAIFGVLFDGVAPTYHVPTEAPPVLDWADLHRTLDAWEKAHPWNAERIGAMALSVALVVIVPAIATLGGAL